MTPEAIAALLTRLDESVPGTVCDAFEYRGALRCARCYWVRAPHDRKEAVALIRALLQWKKGVQARPGRVDWQAARSRLSALGIELRGGGADEAPECYKRLPDVLAHHGDTIEVTHTLRPIGVAMAGAETFDPYKD